MNSKILEQFRALADLIRIRNCLLAFVGVWMSASFASVHFFKVHYVLAAAAAFLITGAGNTINDYFDVEIDKINNPERPIPAGAISKTDALMLALILFATGLALAKAVNPYCLTLATFNSALLIVYGRYGKDLLLISNLEVSYLVGSIFIFGSLATFPHQGNLMENSGLRVVALLAACAFLLTMSREIIKDIEDMKGDEYQYSTTLPLKIGSRRSKYVATFFTFSAIFLSLLPFFLPFTLNLPSYGIVIGIADVVFLTSLTMYPSLGQRLMVVGMGLALIGFLLGIITYAPHLEKIMLYL